MPTTKLSFARKTLGFPLIEISLDCDSSLQDKIRKELTVIIRKFWKTLSLISVFPEAVSRDIKITVEVFKNFGAFYRKKGVNFDGITVFTGNIDHPRQYTCSVYLENGNTLNLGREVIGRACFSALLGDEYNLDTRNYFFTKGLAMLFNSAMLPTEAALYIGQDAEYSMSLQNICAMQQHPFSIQDCCFSLLMVCYMKKRVFKHFASTIDAWYRRDTIAIQKLFKQFVLEHAQNFEIWRQSQTVFLTDQLDITQPSKTVTYASSASTPQPIALISNIACSKDRINDPLSSSDMSKPLVPKNSTDVNVKRSLSLADVKRLEENCIAVFRLLKHQLHVFLQHEQIQYDFKYASSDLLEFKKVCYKLRDHMQQYAVEDIPTLEQSQVGALRTALQNLFLFIQSKIVEYPLLPGNFYSIKRSLIASYQIDGTLYNAIVALTGLYPTNQLHADGSPISEYTKSKITNKVILLSNFHYVSLDDIKYYEKTCPDYSDNDKVWYCSHPILEGRWEHAHGMFDYSPQDVLKMIWVAEKYNIVLDNNSFLLSCTMHEVSTLLLSYDDAELVPFRLLQRQYLDFYMQLVKRNYSIDSIAAFSKFFFANGLGDWQSDNSLKLKVLSESIIYSKEQVAEVTNIVRQYNDILISMNLKEALGRVPVEYVSLYDAFNEVIQIQEVEAAPTDTLISEINAPQDVLDNAYVESQKQLWKIHLLTAVKQVYTQLTHNCSLVFNNKTNLLNALQSFHSSTDAENVTPVQKQMLVRALKHIKSKLMDEHDVSTHLLKASIYSALINYYRCYPENKRQAVDQRFLLLDPITEKPIKQQSGVVLETGYYVDAYNITQALSENIAKDYSKLSIQLKKEGHLSYQTIIYKVGDEEYDYAWQDIIRILHQTEYALLVPIELSDAGPTKAWIMSAAQKVEWQKTCNNPKHLYLTDDHLSRYIEQIDNNITLSAITHENKKLGKQPIKPNHTLSVPESVLSFKFALVSSNQLNKLDDTLEKLEHYAFHVDSEVIYDDFFGVNVTINDKKFFNQVLQRISSLIQSSKQNIKDICRKTSRPYSQAEQYQDQNVLRDIIYQLQNAARSIWNDPKALSLYPKKTGHTYSTVSLSQALYRTVLNCTKLYPRNEYEKESGKYLEMISMEILDQTDDEIALGDGYIYSDNSIINTIKSSLPQHLASHPATAIEDLSYIDINHSLTTISRDDKGNALPSYALLLLINRIKNVFTGRIILSTTGELWTFKGKEIKNFILITSTEDKKNRLRSLRQYRQEMSEPTAYSQSKILSYDRLFFYSWLAEHGLSLFNIVALNEQFEKLTKLQLKQVTEILKKYYTLQPTAFHIEQIKKDIVDTVKHSKKISSFLKQEYIIHALTQKDKRVPSIESILNMKDDVKEALGMAFDDFLKKTTTQLLPNNSHSTRGLLQSMPSNNPCNNKTFSWTGLNTLQSNQPSIRQATQQDKKEVKQPANVEIAIPESSTLSAAKAARAYWQTHKPKPIQEESPFPQPDDKKNKGKAVQTNFFSHSRANTWSSTVASEPLKTTSNDLNKKPPITQKDPVLTHDNRPLQSQKKEKTPYTYQPPKVQAIPSSSGAQNNPSVSTISLEQPILSGADPKKSGRILEQLLAIPHASNFLKKHKLDTLEDLSNAVGSQAVFLALKNIQTLSIAWDKNNVVRYRNPRFLKNLSKYVNYLAILKEDPQLISRLVMEENTFSRRLKELEDKNREHNTRLSTKKHLLRWLHTTIKIDSVIDCAKSCEKQPCDTIEQHVFIAKAANAILGSNTDSLTILNAENREKAWSIALIAELKAVKTYNASTRNNTFTQSSAPQQPAEDKKPPVKDSKEARLKVSAQPHRRRAHLEAQKSIRKFSKEEGGPKYSNRR